MSQSPGKILGEAESILSITDTQQRTILSLLPVSTTDLKLWSSVEHSIH